MITTLEKKTKFVQIRDNLRELMITGDLKPGDRFYSENRLAKMFGVARMTINKVLTVLENEGLLERIQGKGTFVTRRIELLRKKHRVNRPATLALLSSYNPEHLLTPFTPVTQFINYLDDQAFESRYKVTVFNIQDRKTIPKEVFNEFKGKQFAGIIIIHLGLPGLEKEIQKLKEIASIPIVLGDGISPQVDSLDYDHKWIGWRGADHLMELGHKDIAFLGFETDMNWMHQRIEGFNKACRENQRSCSNHRIFKTKAWRYGDEDMQRQEIAEQFDELTDNYSAVMCANDKIAGLLMDVAKKRQVSIPEQLSVIGVDDDIKMRERNLTTFRFSGEELAKVSLGQLEQRIKSDSQYAPTIRLLKPRLMERSTILVKN